MGCGPKCAQKHAVWDDEYPRLFAIVTGRETSSAGPFRGFDDSWTLGSVYDADVGGCACAKQAKAIEGIWTVSLRLHGLAWGEPTALDKCNPMAFSRGFPCIAFRRVSDRTNQGTDPSSERRIALGALDSGYVCGGSSTL